MFYCGPLPEPVVLRDSYWFVFRLADWAYVTRGRIGRIPQHNTAYTTARLGYVIDRLLKLRNRCLPDARTKKHIGDGKRFCHLRNNE